MSAYVKRAYATPLLRICSDCGESMAGQEPYFVSGLVWPSADDSEWEVELVEATFGGKPIPLSDLSEERQERAKDLLADLASRAEQAVAYGG